MRKIAAHERTDELSAAAAFPALHASVMGTDIANAVVDSGGQLRGGKSACVRQRSRKLLFESISNFTSFVNVFRGL